MNEKINFNNCLFFSSSAFSRNIGRLAESCFEPTGLSSSLAFIMLLVHSEPGIQQKAIAERLELMPSTITRFLDKLEEFGLIKRVFEGKSQFVFPTEAGSAKVGALEEAWMQVYRKYTEALGPDLSAGLKHLIIAANEKLK